MINLGLCIKIKTAKRQHQDGTKPALWVREVGRLAEGPFPQEFQDLLRKKKTPPAWETHPVAVAAKDAGVTACPLGFFIDGARHSNQERHRLS